jgi:hypothetical protein
MQPAYLTQIECAEQRSMRSIDIGMVTSTANTERSVENTQWQKHEKE